MAKSPNHTVLTQSNPVFMWIYSTFHLELLASKLNVNHFEFRSTQVNSGQLRSTQVNIVSLCIEIIVQEASADKAVRNKRCENQLSLVRQWGQKEAG